MNRRWGVVIVLSGFVLLAGCSGVISSESATPSPTETSTDTPTSTVTATSTPTATPTPTPDPVDPDNPYGERELAVAMIDNSTFSYDRADELNATLSYWENHSEQYAGYPVEFLHANSTSDADIIVELVDEIPVCGLEVSLTRHLGCAPVPEENAPSPAIIEVDNRFTADSTIKILKHEFGHVLGINHGEDPMPLMANNTSAAPQEIEFTVAVDVGPDYHPTTINRQTAGAIEFFENGGNGTVASDVTIREVEDPEEAFIYMDVTGKEGACGGDIYCVDSNLECHMKAQCSVEGKPVVTITTENIVGDVVGWLLAYEMARYLYMEHGLTEWPAELNPDDSYPSNTWWR